jgi:hypothetical protein
LAWFETRNYGKSRPLCFGRMRTIVAGERLTPALDCSWLRTVGACVLFLVHVRIAAAVHERVPRRIVGRSEVWQMTHSKAHGEADAPSRLIRASPYAEGAVIDQCGLW